MPHDDTIDTNVFVHAQVGDHLAPECRAFLAAVERGDIEAELTAPVMHELTYILPRVIRQMTRGDVASYLLGVLTWPGITGEVEVLTDTIQRWQQTPGLAFVDAYLCARAAAIGGRVYTKNVQDLRLQGVMAPDPLQGHGATQNGGAR